MIINEEILGAYLEGNLSTEEAADVQQIIDSNPDLQSFVDDVENLEVNWEDTIDDSVSDYNLVFDLPSLEDPDYSAIGFDLEIVPEIEPDVDNLDNVETNSDVTNDDISGIEPSNSESSNDDYLSNHESPLEFDDNSDSICDTSNNIGE